VEEMMADIATIFHWQLSDMNALDLNELGRWWAKAKARAPLSVIK